MKDFPTNILIGAIIGSVFTIVTSFVLEKIKRNRIKKTISSYLADTISPKIDKLKEELKTVSSAIEKYNSGDVALGMHPTFNSVVMKSFNMVDLQLIYDEKFSKIINVIGYLDNLEKRLPHFYFKEYVKDVEQHLEEQFEMYKNIYPTKDNHFHNCPSIIAIRNRTKGNLDNIDDILNQLKTHIDLIA